MIRSKYSKHKWSALAKIPIMLKAPKQFPGEAFHSMVKLFIQSLKGLITRIWDVTLKIKIRIF